MNERYHDYNSQHSLLGKNCGVGRKRERDCLGLIMINYGSYSIIKILCVWGSVHFIKKWTPIINLRSNRSKESSYGVINEKAPALTHGKTELPGVFNNNKKMGILWFVLLCFQYKVSCQGKVHFRQFA